MRANHQRIFSRKHIFEADDAIRGAGAIIIVAVADTIFGIGFLDCRFAGGAGFPRIGKFILRDLSQWIDSAGQIGDASRIFGQSGAK